ncbi:MAG: sigma-70 family RNA polymerase sigma factor [Acidobacteria bacterium]|nr:sigma-70 family RNA polymerase sigma factor [Acidobacteriota bacterium]
MSLAGDLSDIELMLGVKNGAPELLDPLLRRHRNSLIHFLYRMVQNSAVAEELAQDVFLRVYRARDSYQPSAHFTTWLYRIAQNRAINWVRDNRHHRNAKSLDQLLVPRASSWATPEQELLRSEKRQRVRAAVEALPERQRVAVLLHKYSELDYVQIAQVLGCSVSAVKALVNRAYFTLRLTLATASQV